MRNIYSKFPSCDCEWAFQGNMCKHQVKALLLRGHSEGVIAQQLGTRFGSNFDGIEPPQSLDIVPLPLDELPFLELEVVDGDCSPTDDVQSCTPAMNPRKLHHLVEELTQLVEGNEQLYQNAVHTIQQGISDISQIKQSQILTGKDSISIIDRFAIPLGLTKKRREVPEILPRLKST